ncbi:MAG TPA: acyl-CoA desaturase [Gammaproteobacteria bacterium]|nr:acyl-CoA desaturase [Gammaproteobacteria bacterium]
MQQSLEETRGETAPPRAARGLGPRLKFGHDTGFQSELRRRVEDFIRRTGLRQRDCPRMYVKTAIILAAFMLSYVLLVFVVRSWWQALPLVVILGLATAEIGFNIQHDGGHKAYSDHAWVNKLMAMTLEMVGGSSYVWRWKHVVFHHTYVNVKGHDTDIDLGIFGRLSPQHRRRALHRWQHFYLWPLYGVMVIKWHFYDDFHDVITGHIGENRIPRPRGWELVLFIGGKIAFLVMAFGIPLLFHPLWSVVLFYAVIAGIVGVVLSVVFQLAHTVEQADFACVDKITGRVQNAWAVHQVQSSVDFARNNRVVSWLVGGLNFQIEHHLFPTLNHVNYPAISGIVENTCREFGVRYSAHPTFRAAVASHFRWLRRMALSDTPA